MYEAPPPDHRPRLPRFVTIYLLLCLLCIILFVIVAWFLSGVEMTNLQTLLLDHTHGWRFL
jgi:hypothetical protein